MILFHPTSLRYAGQDMSSRNRRFFIVRRKPDRGRQYSPELGEKKWRLHAKSKKHELQNSQKS